MATCPECDMDQETCLRCRDLAEAQHELATARRELAELRAKDTWTSVKVRVPTHGLEVIVRRIDVEGKVKVGSGWFHTQGWSGATFSRNGGVTHWREFPKFTEKETP